MKIEIKDKLIVENFDKGMIILNIHTGKYLEANEMGSKIFTLLKKYGDTETVYLNLNKQYEINETTLRKDIEAFVQDLKKLNILKIIEN